MAVTRAMEVFIDELLEEIEGGVVEEQNLQRLEDFVKTLQEERYVVQESVKEAYCQVAVACTAKYLTYKENSREAYVEAIRRIWLSRIMPLCDKVSVLVTRDLLNAFQRLWAAHNDEEACENLMNENTRQKALVALKKLVSEMIPVNHPASDDGKESMYESGETESMVEEREIEVNQESKASEAVDKDKEETRDEIGETEPMAEAREIDVNQKCKASEAVDNERGEIEETESMAEAREIEVNQKCKASKAVDKEKDEIGETDSMVEAREIEVNQKSMVSEAVDKDQECETESPPRQIQSTSSLVVDKVVGGLRVIKHELVNALEEEIPSNVNNEMLTEQEDDVCRPSHPSTVLRRSLMERRTTAHTYEWDDSIDTSAEELSDEGERNNISKRKRIAVCPMKRNQSSGNGGRRKRTPWTSAETEALMKGYEMYGTNWKQIKDEFPILERRTNDDLKVKFRVETRREVANTTPE